jgi:hypothetical protein
MTRLSKYNSARSAVKNLFTHPLKIQFGAKRHENTFRTTPRKGEADVIFMVLRSKTMKITSASKE